MMKFYITDEYEKARGSIRRPTPRTIDKIFCAKNDMAVFQILCVKKHPFHLAAYILLQI